MGNTNGGAAGGSRRGVDDAAMTGVSPAAPSGPSAPAPASTTSATGDADVDMGEPTEASSGSGGGKAGAGAGGGGGKKRTGPQTAKLEDFLLLKTVGKGSFGKVVQVRRKDDENVYAMKILKKEMVLKRKQYEHTLSERRILENIDHPFIVSLRFAFQTEHKLYMVFDFFNGGELYHYLSEGGRFTEDRARFYAAEILSGLDYLHRKHIVYRDLKPENIILDSEGHVRITDFGLSKEGVEGDTIKSICGTPEYLAPEILRKQTYGHCVDWWSLGTLLYEMICGLPPFYDRNRQVMYRKILHADLNPPPHMSAEALDLCSRMLIRDPTKRLGYNGGDELRAHPFFAGIDWSKLDAMEIRPPWVPFVAGSEDTSNISSDFTKEPAAVTPSPATNHVLRDAAKGTPPSFGGFTFTHENVLDGETYRVSFSDDEYSDLER